MLKTDIASSRPALIVFLTLVFMLPISDGSLENVLVYSLLMILLAFIVLWHYRHDAVSFTAFLHKEHPLAWYLFLAWLIAASISCLLVSLRDEPFLQTFMAWYRHITILLYVLITFAIARICVAHRLSHVRIYTVLTLGVLLVIFLHLLIYHFGPTPRAAIWAKFPPFGSHVRNFGNVVAVVAVVSSLFFLNRVSMRHGNWFWPLMALISWSYLVWNGGRASMAAALITVLVFAVYGLVYRTALKRHLAVLLLIIAAGFYIGDSFSVFGWNGLQRAMAVSTPTVASHTANAESSAPIFNDRITSGRVTIWSESLRAYKEHPWFGLGPYGYYFITPPLDDDQPHNIIVQFLVEWGAVGTVLMLSLLAYCAWFGLTQLPGAFRERDFGYIASGAVVLLLTMDGLTAGTYFKVQPMLCLCIAFASFPFGRRNRLTAS